MESSSRRGAGLLVAAGVALGVALPPLLRKVRAAAAAKGGDNTTHAVRGGLSAATSVRLAQSTLDAFLAAVLVAAGCSAENAALVANVLTFADARGIPSHGCNRADTYINEIAAGVGDVKAKPAGVERRARGTRSRGPGS